MKGVDYSKALSKERDYFKDTIKKTEASAERRIADNNERTEGKVKKQRETFIEDKADLESTYQANLDKLNEKTRDSLSNNNDNFHDERAKEREAFTQEAMTKRKDFDQRLNDIKNSYQKAFSAEKATNEDVNQTNKKKYDKNITNTIAHSDKLLNDYREEMTGHGAGLKDQYNRERQQIVRSHEDQMTAAHKESSTKRAEMKDLLREDFQKSKDIQAADFDQQKQYTNDRMTTMREKFENRNQTMAKDYSVRSDKLVETQQKDAKKINHENQQHLTDARRDFNKQLRLIDLDKRRRDNGSGEFSEVMDRQQGMRDANTNDTRFRDLKDQMANTQNVYHEKTVADQSSFTESLKKETAEATARLDRKLNEANADKIINVSREREKAEVQVSNRENQNRLDKQAYEQQLIVQRNNADSRLTKLKENFNSSMMQLQEKHQFSVEDVTKVSNKDKAEFVKKINETRNKENSEIRREFTRLMDRTVQDYEVRIANYQRDNEYLKITMDQKIQNITDVASKQLEVQRTLFESRHAADIKNSQELMDQKEHQWKTATHQTNGDFQKKIDKMQIEGDTKLKLLTNDYENKLIELKALTSKELAQKDTDKQSELARVKSVYEDEKARMVSGFDSQIEAIKIGHRDQMEALKSFKKLS